MTAAAPTSSETPILPFPVPRTPAFDRPPGMRGSRLPHHPETIAVVRLLYAHDAQAPRDRGTGRGLEDLGAWLGACGRLEAPARRAEKSPARPERPAGAPAQGPKRLRELAEAYLEEMEKDFDTRDAEKCGIVLNFLKEAKLLEQRRKPRRPLAVRARSIAERWLDQRPGVH